MSKRAFCFGIAAVMILALCAGCGQVKQADPSDSQVVHSELKAEGVATAPETSGGEGVSTRVAEAYKTQSEELLQKAFSFDASKYTPDVGYEGGLTYLEYVMEKGDFYYVSYRKELPYPTMVYHFCHIGEKPDFDLAKESSDYFKEEMVTTAKAYVKKVYGVDCEKAEVHAYGYSTKIAVQLQVASDQIFHVRFYYNEPEPVGVLFYNDVAAFNEAMESNHAKTYR
jgi:hypothetical protein